MAPDVPYYIPVPVDDDLTHSLVGVVGVDLLLGAVVFAVWQVLVGPAVVAFSPVGVRRRLARPVPAGLRHHFGARRRAVLVAVALVLGGVTHVGWDALTHAGMWGADHVVWLAERHGPLPGYEWAQHVSGLVGAAFIATWCARWWRTQPVSDAVTAPDPPRGLRVAVWAVVVLCAVVGALYGILEGLDGEADRLRGALFLATTRGGGAATGATVLVAAGWTVWTAKAVARRGRP